MAKCTRWATFAGLLTLLVAPHTTCSVLQAGSALSNECVRDTNQVFQKPPGLHDQAHSCILTDCHDFRRQKKQIHEWHQVILGYQCQNWQVWVCMPDWMHTCTGEPIKLILSSCWKVRNPPSWGSLRQNLMAGLTPITALCGFISSSLGGSNEQSLHDKFCNIRQACLLIFVCKLGSDLIPTDFTSRRPVHHELSIFYQHLQVIQPHQ